MYSLGQTPRKPPKPLKSTPEISEGSIGWVKLLDTQVNGIIPSRMRHVIKRYSKRVGFKDIRVEHEPDKNPLMLRLIAVGYSQSPVTKEQMRKIRYLRECVAKIINEAYVKAGHASKADPEKLRIMLARMEPSLKKVYYTKPITT